MNFALLLTGEYRTFQRCFPSIQKHVLGVYHPDTYLCLPAGQSNEICGLYHPIAAHFVSEEENRAAIGDSEARFANKANEAVVPANVSLFWKWKKCYELMGDKRYDVIFMARPDIHIYDMTLDFSNPITANTLYLPAIDALGTVYTSEHEYYGGWGGQFVFGDQRVAEVSSRMYDNMDAIYATYKYRHHQFGDWHTERNYKRWMTMNGIDMKTFEIDFQIIRNPDEH